MGSRKSRKSEKKAIDFVPRNKPSPPAAQGFHKPVKLFLLLAPVWILTVAVYAGSLTNGFVNWDDQANVLLNPWIRAVTWESLKVYFTQPLLEMYQRDPDASVKAMATALAAEK